MRILLAHKFYYLKGGADIHALILEKMLKEKGHEVAFFAMQHPDNEPSGYASYFPSEIDYTRRNYRNLREQIIRPIASGEVKRKFRSLLDHFKPDVLHCHNIHSQLSPVIVELAAQSGIPVVWTLHDLKLLCPRYDCWRNEQSCELCFNKKWHAVRYRCLKNSLPASLIAYLEAKKWNREKMSRFTTRFLSPSEFLRQKFIKGGFNADQITTINNFITSDEFNEVGEEKENYICYVGRLSKEKGVETLLRASAELPQYHLKIVGTGPLYNSFVEKYNHPHIEFCGYKKIAEVKDILSGAVFSVMPSECYENNPLAVIESLYLGTPVLGANIGGIPELIAEEKNGFLFESGDKENLKEKIVYFWEEGVKKMDANKMAGDARQKYSVESYYQQLMEVYQEIQATENAE